MTSLICVPLLLPDFFTFYALIFFFCETRPHLLPRYHPIGNTWGGREREGYEDHQQEHLYDKVAK